MLRAPNKQQQHSLMRLTDESKTDLNLIWNPHIFVLLSHKTRVEKLPVNSSVSEQNHRHSYAMYMNIVECDLLIRTLKLLFGSFTNCQVNKHTGAAVLYLNLILYIPYIHACEIL